MRQTLPIIISVFFSFISYGQKQDIWVRFYDTTTEQSGYKDLKGNIKIPARFEGFTRADTFYSIIAVTEKVDTSYKSYYLLKDGKKVGYDSVFMFDFTVDCESEGKIIFYDRKADGVGFLDKKGVAIIPAVYNYVSPFRNGLAIAHRNAKRKCWDERGDTAHCEHWGWEGGETVLIDENNQVLTDSLSMDLNSINWYSKKVNDTKMDTSIYVKIKGKKDINYWFIDFDKEFKKWFYNTFLPTLKNKATLQNLLFDEVTYWSDKEGWISLKKNIFIQKFPGALTMKRFEPNRLKEISLSQETFNEMIYDKAIYKKYLNACGEHNRNRFPLYNVMLTYYKKRSAPIADIQSEFHRDYEINYQEHFEFLRTEKGYRLLGVSMKR